MQGRHFYFGVVCVFVSAVGFSGKAIIVKLAYRYNVDPLTLLALRMLFSLPFFIVMAFYASGGTALTMTRQDWLTIFGLGGIGYYLSSYLDFLGLQYISAGLERLILFLNPTIVFALSIFMFGQIVTWRHLISLILSYGGIVLLVYEHVVLGDSLPRLLLGGGLVFASAVTYAIYLVAGGRLVVRMGSMRFAAYASIVACGFVLGHYLLAHGITETAIPHAVYGLAIVMALVSTVIPVWLMAEGMRHIGAIRAAMMTSVGPLATILLGYIFLHESITSTQLAGASFVLTGVLIISGKTPTATAKIRQDV